VGARGGLLLGARRRCFRFDPRVPALGPARERGHHGVADQHPTRTGQGRSGRDDRGPSRQHPSSSNRDAGPRAHRAVRHPGDLRDSTRRAVRHHRRRQRPAPGHPTAIARRRVRARLRPRGQTNFPLTLLAYLDPQVHSSSRTTRGASERG
jgi:hypothetical protein